MSLGGMGSCYGAQRQHRRDDQDYQDAAHDPDIAQRGQRLLDRAAHLAPASECRGRISENPLRGSIAFRRYTISGSNVFCQSSARLMTAPEIGIRPSTSSLALALKMSL